MASYSSWMLIFVIVLLGLGIVVTNFLYKIGSELMMLGADTLYLDLYVVFMGIAFLVLYIGFAFFLRQWGLLIQKYHDSELQAQHRRMKDDYYDSINQSLQKMNYFRHDFRKHFGVLQMFLTSNETEKALEYVTNLQGDYSKYLDIFHYTDDDVLNAILSNKKALASQHGIAVKLSIGEVGKFPISSNEVCSLFDNLLDNAIEASKNVNGERFIDLYLSENDYLIKIVLSNNYSKDIITQGGELKTTKTDKKGHGIGLKIVNDIVRQANGEFYQDNNISDKVFTTTITLPKPNRSE